MQQAPVIGMAKGVIARSVPAVPRIRQQEQRLVAEHFLRLSLADGMLLSALARVAGIPIKANDAVEIEHGVYCYHIRNDQATSKKAERIPPNPMI